MSAPLLVTVVIAGGIWGIASAVIADRRGWSLGGSLALSVAPWAAAAAVMVVLAAMGVMK